MPRPKKFPGDLRSERITVWLTPAEALRIAEAAIKAGVSSAEYARMQALDGHVVVREHRSLSPETFEELRRIGVNLNQLTRKFNSTDEMPRQLADLCETFDRFIAQELAYDPKNG